MARRKNLTTATHPSCSSLLVSVSVWVGSAILLAGPQQRSAPPRALPPDDRVVRAVVQLLAIGPAAQGENQECSATGFLIDEEGYLITNWHVVEAARRCLENAPGAKILAKLIVNDARTAPAVPCDVVGGDPANDLALLKTEQPLFVRAGEKPPFAPLDARNVPVGIMVRVSGYPALSWQPVTQTGRVAWTGRTGLAETDAPAPRPSDALMMDIRLRPGNSGSPVYLPNGGVIGVVDKRDSLRVDYSIAVAIHYAIELANRYGAHWRAPQ